MERGDAGNAPEEDAIVFANTDGSLSTRAIAPSKPSKPPVISVSIFFLALLTTFATIGWFVLTENSSFLFKRRRKKQEDQKTKRHNIKTKENDNKRLEYKRNPQRLSQKY